MLNNVLNKFFKITWLPSCVYYMYTLVKARCNTRALPLLLATAASGLLLRDRGLDTGEMNSYFYLRSGECRWSCGSHCKRAGYFRSGHNPSEVH